MAAIPTLALILESAKWLKRDRGAIAEVLQLEGYVKDLSNLQIPFFSNRSIQRNIDPRKSRLTAI